ncbi:hypothetical protein Pla110_12010 [Polystyrenella longa]|uniref:DUF3592 domain-containing protein n=1 Tax=Polystyrenella longa TaxID=2528007 RepID=A0A518CJT6_9PLAN|nr:DUF3592 domain-containing protein [Polystyrenella longa]QDU79491.1 hypothetical protein Pla110_12010 [Polystyrenella longa]
MSVTAKCGSCQKTYKVKDELAGKKFKCKQCGELVRIPTSNTSSSRSRKSIPKEDFGFDEEPVPRRTQKRSRQQTAEAEDDFGFEAAPLPPKRRSRKPPKRNLDRTPERTRNTEPLNYWMLKGKVASEKEEDTEDWKLLMFAIGGVIMTLAIPFVTWYSVSHVYTASTSTSWPTVEATVIVSGVAENLRGRRWSRRWEYTPVVKYTYFVEAKKYENDEIAFHSLSSRDPLDAESISEHYSEGSKHSVYYSPGDPEESVLQPGASGWDFAALLFPLICLLGPNFAYNQGLAFYYRINADLKAQFG